MLTMSAEWVGVSIILFTKGPAPHDVFNNDLGVRVCVCVRVRDLGQGFQHFVHLPPRPSFPNMASSPSLG